MVPFGDCHEGCFRLQTQELLSIVPPQCRIPLTREPSAPGTPPPPAYSHQSIRRPGSLKITAPCVHRACRVCHGGCSAAPRPPRPASNPPRQPLPHPSRQFIRHSLRRRRTPHSASDSVRRARERRQPNPRPSPNARPPSIPKGVCAHPSAAGPCSALRRRRTVGV